VPVIAIFTKFDALHTVAFGELREQGKGIQAAVAMAPRVAEQIFQDNNYYGMLQEKEFPPKNFVCIGGMEKEEADCTALIECTAEALHDEVLETLLVSAQQVNLQICVQYAASRVLLQLLENKDIWYEAYGKDGWVFQARLAVWFPHLVGGLLLRDGHDDYFRHGHAYDDLRGCLHFNAFKVDWIQKPLLQLCHGSNTNQACILSASVLIILVHSFYSWDRAKKEDHHLTASFEQFIKSSHPEVVALAVKQAIESCGEDCQSLCNEIIKIVWKYPLEHPTLTKTSLTNAEPVITTVHSTVTKPFPTTTGPASVKEPVSLKQKVSKAFHKVFKHP